MRNLLALFFSILVVTQCFAKSATPTVSLGNHPLIGASIISPSSLIEFSGIIVEPTVWLENPPDYAPTSNPEDAQTYYRLYKKKLEESVSPAEESQLKRIQTSMAANLSNARFWQVFGQKPKKEGQQDSLFNAVHVERTNFVWEPQMMISLYLRDFTKGKLKVMVLCFSKNGGAQQWVQLTSKSESTVTSEFPLDLTSHKKDTDSFEPSDASDVALVDGTKKANLKRLDIDIQRVFGGSNLRMKGKFSTDSKDLEANFAIDLSGRRLVNLKDFRTVSYGLKYETNQLGTNQMATIGLGTLSFFDVPVGRSIAGQAGLRSYGEFKIEGAYWIRQDSRTSAANAKKAGTWVTGEIGFGPMFLGLGDTAFYTKAKGYYFPMKDRTFGNNVNAFEGFIEAGLLVPIRVNKDEAGKVDGYWLRLGYTNGAERANGFANKSSFAITFTTNMKF